LVGGGVAGDYDFVWEISIAGGVGDGGVAEPAFGSSFGVGESRGESETEEAEGADGSHGVLEQLLWSKGERTSAAKAAIRSKYYGTAEAVPFSNTF
jgi:hypothetical protein